jgi:hypothetical protein
MFKYDPNGLFSNGLFLGSEARAQASSKQFVHSACHERVLLCLLFNPKGIASFSPRLARFREGLPWVAAFKSTTLKGLNIK